MVAVTSNNTSPSPQIPLKAADMTDSKVQQVASKTWSSYVWIALCSLGALSFTALSFTSSAFCAIPAIAYLALTIALSWNHQNVLSSQEEANEDPFRLKIAEMFFNEARSQAENLLQLSPERFQEAFSDSLGFFKDLKEFPPYFIKIYKAIEKNEKYKIPKSGKLEELIHKSLSLISPFHPDFADFSEVLFKGEFLSQKVIEETHESYKKAMSQDPDLALANSLYQEKEREISLLEETLNKSRQQKNQRLDLPPAWQKTLQIEVDQINAEILKIEQESKAKIQAIEEKFQAAWKEKIPEGKKQRLEIFVKSLRTYFNFK